VVSGPAQIRTWGRAMRSLKVLMSFRYGESTGMCTYWLDALIVQLKRRETRRRRPWLSPPVALSWSTKSARPATISEVAGSVPGGSATSSSLSFTP
jgi:hypothetical protein